MDPSRCCQLSLHSDSLRKQQPPLEVALWQLGHLLSKGWTGSLLYTCRDVKWGLIKVERVLSKCWTHKENRESSLSRTLTVSLDFFSDTKSITNKSKCPQEGLHHPKRRLHRKNASLRPVTQQAKAPPSLSWLEFNFQGPCGKRKDMNIAYVLWQIHTCHDVNSHTHTHNQSVNQCEFKNI